jgi:hypothetical protein
MERLAVLATPCRAVKNLVGHVGNHVGGRRSQLRMVIILVDRPAVFLEMGFVVFHFFGRKPVVK